MVTCFHCREPLDECRRTLLADATDKAVKELGWNRFVNGTEADELIRLGSAWDAAATVNELVDLVVALDYGITVEGAYERARALIEEAACAR
ncbi:hypothetical protein ACQP1V_43010 (plasmid) [Microtetraspora malaysiensis]|uniref:hypothetical protein n=1 Tax=Microtetraspora malaysiensis TaxID=161358 RepID=UPI003D8BA9DB